MNFSELDLIPDNRRGLLEHWLTHCRDGQVDIEAMGAFWNTETTPEEIRALLSAFDCADEMYERMIAIHTMWPDPVDEEALLEVLRDYMSELASNARLIGQESLATAAEAVRTCRHVDKAELDRACTTEHERKSEVSALNDDIGSEVQDAVIRDVCGHPDKAAGRLFCAMDEWCLPAVVEAFLMQPFIREGLNFNAAIRLWSLGCQIVITEDAVLTTYTPWGPAPPAPVPPIMKSIAAKQAARVGVDWSDFPTSQSDIATLRAAGDAGDHPALAKLSLMQMAGIGVPYDLPAAFGLLERAAGDYPSVVACYQVGREMNVAAAHYGMHYLATMGWGVPLSKDDAAAHLQTAADCGFPHAMYLLGMHHRSGTSEEVQLAERWLTRAAASGYHEAYRMLFHIYQDGELADVRKAFFWLKRTANEHASTNYQLWLGEAYEKGKATARDFIQAYTWYYLAACQGAGERRNGLTEMERLRGMMPSEDIEEATARALAWIEHNNRRLGDFEGSGRLFTDPVTLS